MAGSMYSTVRTNPLEEQKQVNSGPVIFEPHGPSWHMLTGRSGLVLATAGMGLVALVAISMSNGISNAKTHTFTRVPNLQQGTIQQKSESAGLVPLLVKVLQEMSEGIHGAAEISEEVGTSYEDAKKLFKTLNGSAHNFKKVGEELVNDLGKPIRLSKALEKELHSLTPAKKALLRQQILQGLNLTSLADLRPAAGGCNEDEELHASLCYKRCALVTEGREPVRVSAFQCCTHQAPCTGEVDAEPMLCGGYAVGGSASGNGCAREPARCLQSEEFEVGLCYLRCNLLTSGMLPYRSTSDTCCKTQSPLAMLELGSCLTHATFDVAAGSQNSGAPNVPHPPLENE